MTFSSTVTVILYFHYLAIKYFESTLNYTKHTKHAKYIQHLYNEIKLFLSKDLPPFTFSSVSLIFPMYFFTLSFGKRNYKMQINFIKI